MAERPVLLGILKRPLAVQQLALRNGHANGEHARNRSVEYLLNEDLYVCFRSQFQPFAIPVLEREFLDLWPLVFESSESAWPAAVFHIRRRTEADPVDFCASSIDESSEGLPEIIKSFWDRTISVSADRKGRKTD